MTWYNCLQNARKWHVGNNLGVQTPPCCIPCNSQIIGSRIHKKMVMVFNPELGNWWWQFLKDRVASESVLEVSANISRYKEILSDSLGHCQLGKTLIQSTGVKSKFKVNYKWQMAIYKWFGATNSLQMVTAAMKLKDTYSFKGTYKAY